MLFRTLLVTAAFVGATTLAASAEGTASPPAAGSKANGNISAATHCLDANGQVQLKSAMKDKSATTGTGSTAQGQRPQAAQGQRPASGTAAASLPTC
jgi:hypothetical protein